VRPGNEPAPHQVALLEGPATRGAFAAIAFR
jgi:hypothetical protein